MERSILFVTLNWSASRNIDFYSDNVRVTGHRGVVNELLAFILRATTTNNKNIGEKRR